MHRLLTRSSSLDVWLEECGVFYSHLRNRGYPSKAVYSNFESVTFDTSMRNRGDSSHVLART